MATTDKSEEQSGPIFIVGMNGSGTTMLADCLNQHPAIFIPKHEVKVIPAYYRTIDRFGDLKHLENFQAVLNDFANSHAFRRLNHDRPVQIPFTFQRLPHHDLSTVIDLTFRYFAGQEGKTIWGDHSPKYALALPSLIALFPKAKIIHMIRDGRDCALSVRRRYHLNIYHSIYQWKTIVRKARKDGTALGGDRYLAMKYEELTGSPEDCFRRIFAFLGLPFDRSVLASNRPMVGPEIADCVEVEEKIFVNSGKWEREFSKRQIRGLENIGGQCLADTGYKTLFHRGDHNPHPFMLRLWTWHDRLQAAIVYCRTFKGRNLPGALWRIFSAARKQQKYSHTD